MRCSETEVKGVQEGRRETTPRAQGLLKVLTTCKMGAIPGFNLFLVVALVRYGEIEKQRRRRLMEQSPNKEQLI